ncbi:hypothetical protein L3Q82_006666 [Scortum barcoo]|uniref:Uncharacterized protein n=1 Tax=Scortum barcoo TaxID=214431 RepID=A0ACB8WZ79_9TELE|nr:hypothetical protein L3Q82_006666 [Scortum barcoo]
MAYREEVRALTSWCQDNNLHLNVSNNTKDGSEENQHRLQDPLQLLQVTHREDPDWLHHRLLWQLLLLDREALQREVKAAQHISRTELPSMEDLYTQRGRRKTTRIITDLSHRATDCSVCCRLADGGSPYPDLPMTRDFYSALKRGYRMSQPDHAPHNIFDLMKQCWEEKPQSRPSFSSLVVSVGNMLTDDYKKSVSVSVKVVVCQRYLQMTEDFLKGENPAVVRSRLSSSRAAEDQTDGQTDTNGSPAPQVNVHLLKAVPEEAGPSHSTYIIPITDITIETSSCAALDAVRN